MKPAQYDDDHMPKEVATALLLGKQKLTPQMRRMCKLARQRMLPSIAPVKRDGDHYSYDMRDMTRVASDKLARKYAQLGFMALLRRHKRVVAKRRAAQFGFFHSKTDKMRAAWEAVANTCDEHRDALEFELKRRHNKK